MQQINGAVIEKMDLETNLKAPPLIVHLNQ